MCPRRTFTSIPATDTVVAERSNGTTSAAGVEAESIDSSAHDEWLLDEALAETFPASDPISPSIGALR
ncbi:MAG TPA: hypothetical protein VGO85_19890 [Caldimonas sp.]|jgi:hypothetical protein|nr:hypothetical protein [Caldimonas sp.]